MAANHMLFCLKRSTPKTAVFLSKYNVNFKTNNGAILQSNIKSMLSAQLYSTSTESSNKSFQVYYGILTPQIRAVKIFSLSTSIGGLAAQPIIFHQSAQLGSVSILVAICTFVGFFTFVTPFLLHLVTKKYVTDIHYDPNSRQYTATILNFFLRKKKIVFSPGDVVVPEIPGMFTSFIAKGVPLFVEARLFEEPAHFAKIMGYDKPIDFKLDLSKKTSNSNQ